MALPLTFVVVLSMIKDAYEDYKRHQSDSKENNMVSLVYDKSVGKFVEKPWCKITPGNVIKVTNDEFIPADLVLIQSSEPKGTLFIETKNLDGETNLKIKNVQKDLNGMIKRESDFGRLEGQINCELPNNAIYKFEGNIEISTMPNRISLGADNMVLRGSSLRNTEYVYGIAVFTGHDTKVMQNSAQAKMKFSRLDLMTNRCIFVIMFF